ncbi:MAG TPA: hypothetical protein VF678_15745, partial [bacterium]
MRASNMRNGMTSAAALPGLWHLIGAVAAASMNDALSRHLAKGHNRFAGRRVAEQLVIHARPGDPLHTQG